MSSQIFLVWHLPNTTSCAIRQILLSFIANSYLTKELTYTTCMMPRNFYIKYTATEGI